MKSFISAIIMLLTTAGTVCAGSSTVTFFPDGSMVELESTAVKGFTEIVLPAGTLGGTLRIRPLGGAVIQRVEKMALRRETKVEKVLESLTEQKNRMEDRLRALATREEIFKSAAKSQSGKAPRKNKSNPDPLQSIRQGTDFAIAQLEAVYTSRRRTGQEIRRIDARIAEIKNTGRGAGDVVRVTVSPQNGRIKVRFVVGEPGWTPRYDIRLDDTGSAHVTLYGQVPASCAGCLLRVALNPLSAGDQAKESVSVLTAQQARLADYRLPVTEANFGTGLNASLGFKLKNTANAYLPAGEAALYRNGEYWGAFRFEGVSSGRTTRVTSFDR